MTESDNAAKIARWLKGSRDVQERKASEEIERIRQGTSQMEGVMAEYDLFLSIAGGDRTRDDHMRLQIIGTNLSHLFGDYRWDVLKAWRDSIVTRAETKD